VTRANEDAEAVISTEAVKALGRLQALLPLWTPVSQAAVFDGDRLTTLRALMVAVARATESTLLLCIYRQAWDAEIVLRSIFEATLKFCYLLQSPATFEERHREFSDDLWHVELLHGHKKTVDMLSVVDGLDERWRDLRARLLPFAEVARIKSRFPRPIRHELERKWGFTGLLQTLVTSNDTMFSNLASMAMGYSTASEVHHVTFTGIAIADERAQRSDDDRLAAERAHESRIISDVFGCLMLRLLIGYRFVDEDPSALLEVRRSWLKSQDVR
jgi:hypothetical protein